MPGQTDDPGVPLDIDCLVSPNVVNVDENGEVITDYTLLMGEDQGPLGCFSCSHIGGENMPAINKTHLKVLNNFVEDFNGTHMDQHCVDSGDMYETLIRRPANAQLQPGETPLPPWNPATIKSHLLYHTRNTRMKRSTIMHYMGMNIQYATKHLMFRTTDRLNNQNRGSGAPDPSTIMLDKDAVKSVKDMIDSYIKLVKLTPKELDRDSVATEDLYRSVQKTGILDPTKKKIQLGNTSLNLDCHFHYSATRLTHEEEDNEGEEAQANSEEEEKGSNNALVIY